MANKWLKKLQNLEGALVDQVNPFSDVIGLPSPSVGFTFGNTWGLPRGFTVCVYGPPKGGKTVFTKMMIGQLHQDDPEAIAVVFDTEFRTAGQLTAEHAKMYGIDTDRLITYQVNAPSMIFDRIEKEIAAMCQEGAPIKLIVIDSLTGVQGRREMNSDSIDNQQIGDHALTIQTGLKRILATQRRYGIALALTCHVRAEMDMLEQKRGNKVKMAASWGVQHHAEYFLFVEPNRNKEGRTDMSGKEMVDEELTDLMGKSERTGHKIRVCMKDSSLGPKGRTGEFTFDYHRGLVNVHEEVFRLGVGRGVIEHPNNLTYSFGDKSWKGVASMLQALAESSDLRAAVIKELKSRDLAGAFASHDVAAAEENGAELIDK